MKLQVDSSPNIKTNLCANRIIKGIKDVASNDPMLIRFLNKLSESSYYDPVSGNFVLDIARWHVDGGILFKTAWTDDVESNDFEKFFKESMTVYYSYLFFKDHVPFIVDDCIMENVMSYIVKYRFAPPHMEIIDNVPPELANKTEGQNDPPKMLPEIPLLILHTDKEFIKQGFEDYDPVASISFGMRDQLTNSVVTGVSSKGMDSNLANMALNQLEVDNISNELLISSVLMMMQDAGAHSQPRVEVQVPDKKELENLIGTYKTGTGVVPANNYVTTHTCSDGTCDITKTKPRTKKALAAFLSNLIVDTLQELWDSNEIRDRVFPGVSVCVSARKFEILNAVDSLNLEELESLHSKLRIFFVESAHCIFLSYISMKGLFEFLSGKGWEAGTSLNDGGFFDIFKRHSCGTHSYDKEKFEKLYEKYPELFARSYFEGDVTKFDQSLLYRVLCFVGIFFATWYNMDHNFTCTVLGNMIFRLMFKYLFIVPLSQLYAVKGMMFSGTFETSHGDTAYQMIVFYAFVSMMLDKHKDHPSFELLKVAVDNDLLQKGFLGDDTTLSWPTIFETLFGMTGDAYKDFAKRFGLRFKYFYKRPLFGTVVHTKIGKVFRTRQTVAGMTFLKNSMCFNFDVIDGVSTFVGFYPYRSNSDLGFRIGNSDRANSTIDGFMAKLMSIAYLSVGNRQMYEYVKMCYSFALSCNHC
jgi:hypothetical protein